MSRQALLDADGLVLNVIEAPDGWDGITPGQSLVPAQNASHGDTWNGSTFIKPRRPAVAPSLRDRYQAASTTAAKLAILAEAQGFLDEPGS